MEFKGALQMIILFSTIRLNKIVEQNMIALQ